MYFLLYYIISSLWLRQRKKFCWEAFIDVFYLPFVQHTKATITFSLPSGNLGFLLIWSISAVGKKKIKKNKKIMVCSALICRDTSFMTHTVRTLGSQYKLSYSPDLLKLQFRIICSRFQQKIQSGNAECFLLQYCVTHLLLNF